LAVEQDFAGVGADGPGDDLGEGAFAGSVFTHEGVDFAGFN
jgi:hypothetical protein